MDNPIGRAWRAITVPTFKMRIAQAFAIVLVIVLSLIVIGSIITVRGASANDLARQAADLYSSSRDLQDGLEGLTLAVEYLETGRAARAEEAFAAGMGKIEDSAERLRGMEELPPGALAVDIAALSLSANSLFETAVEGEDVEESMEGLESSLSDFAGLVQRTRDVADERIAESISRSEDNVRFAVIGFSVCMAATVILGLLAMTISYRGLSGIIRKVIDEVREIASGKGDLTSRVSVPTSDVMGELADSINEMVASLRDSMLEVRSIAGQVNASAESLAGAIEGISASIEEVTGAAEQISTGSESQARNVEETSGAMSGVTRSIDEISSKAKVSSEQSAMAADLVERGAGSVQQAVAVMHDIYSSVKNSERLMKGLGERFAQIGIIIDVITDIADQTNLLALNAAIEAARAGEQGKGFAVVAGEVRSLAENSKRSAEQISHLIREITSETGEVIRSMEDGTGQVETGRQVAETSGEILDGIMVSSRNAATAAEEISERILFIAANTDQVMSSLSDIAAIAEETAASTEEVAATINEQRVSTEDVARASMAMAQLAAKLHELSEGFEL